MAKPKKKYVNVEIVGDGEEEAEKRPPDEEIDPEDMMMEEAARDFAEGDRGIRLYRYPPGEMGGRPRFLGELIRENFTEPFVKSHFGGGRYFGRWKTKRNTYMRFPFEIEGNPIVEQTTEEVETQPTPYTIERPESNQISMAEVLRLMAETRRESRDEMKMILEMMRPAAQNPDTTAQVFSLVEKIVPLIQGGGEPQSPLMFALTQLKEPLLKMVDTIHTAVTRPPTPPIPPAPMKPKVEPAPPSAQVTPPAAEPVKPSEPEKEEDMFLTGFKSYLPMLLAAAKAGKDTGLYAELVLDQVPEFLYPELDKWLRTPGCLDKLASLEPAVYESRRWWEELRAAILLTLSEESNGVRTVQPSPYSDPTTIPTTASSESD